MIGKDGFLMAKSNLIIQTTLEGQDGDIGKSFCLPNGVHMTGQRVMNSRKLKQWTRSRRESLMNASEVESRDSLYSQHSKRLCKLRRRSVKHLGLKILVPRIRRSRQGRRYVLAAVDP